MERLGKNAGLVRRLGWRLARLQATVETLTSSATFMLILLVAVIGLYFFSGVPGADLSVWQEILVGVLYLATAVVATFLFGLMLIASRSAARPVGLTVSILVIATCLLLSMQDEVLPLAVGDAISFGMLAPAVSVAVYYLYVLTGRAIGQRS